MMLFGGAPPEPSQPSAPVGGGQTYQVPGLGQISEEEMRIAMDFRNKIAERMAAIVVDVSALGGKVKVTYDGQGQPTKIDISNDALSQGEAAISAAVIEAAKKAQAESLSRMKQTMMQMQQEIAQTLKKSGGQPS